MKQTGIEYSVPSIAPEIQSIVVAGDFTIAALQAQLAERDKVILEQQARIGAIKERLAAFANDFKGKGRLAGYKRIFKKAIKTSISETEIVSEELPVYEFVICVDGHDDLLTAIIPQVNEILAVNLSALEAALKAERIKTLEAAAENWKYGPCSVEETLLSMANELKEQS